jgi:hypothetical protein
MPKPWEKYNEQKPWEKRQKTSEVTEKDFTMSAGIEPSDDQTIIPQASAWTGVGVEPTEFPDVTAARETRSRERFKYAGATAGGVGAGLAVEAGTVGLATPALPAAVLGGAMVGGGAGGALYDYMYGKPTQFPQQQEQVPDFGNDLMTVPRGIAHGIANLPTNAPRTASALMDMPETILKEVAGPGIGGAAKYMMADTEEDRAKAAEEMGHAVDVVGEFADAMITPYNMFDMPAAAEAWATDPIGSALMGKGIKEVPIAAGRAVKAGVRTAGKTVSETAGQLPGLKPADWMARHMKIKPTDPKYDIKVKTALDNEFTANAAGVEKFYHDLSNLNQEISLKLADATAKGVNIPIKDLMPTFDAMYKQAMKHPFKYKKIRAGLDDIKESLLDHPSIVNGKIPIEVAQKWKVELYRDLRNQYGEISGVEIEGAKMLAKGIKEQIAKSVPGIERLNAKDSLLLAIEDDLIKAAHRIKNKDLIGIGIPIKLTAAMMYNNRFAPMISMALGMLDKPAIQGRLAIMLQRSQNRPLLPGQLDMMLKGLKVNAQKEIKKAVDQFKKDERGMVGRDISQQSIGGQLGKIEEARSPYNPNPALPPKKGTTSNASGESTASVEAMNRNKQLKARGEKLVYEDTRSKKQTDAIGMRPEDNALPSQYHRLVRVSADGNVIETLLKGDKAR